MGQHLFSDDRLFSAPTLAYALTLILVAFYWRVRHGAYVTTRSVLLGWIWVVCGPPHLWYGITGKLDQWIYERMSAALLLMFTGLIVGAEGMQLVFSGRAKKAQRVVRAWQETPLSTYIPRDALYVFAIFVGVFMLFIAVRENQIGKVVTFLALQGQTNEIAIFRGTQGGSTVYLYNLVLSSIAPFLSFLILLTPIRRHWGLLFARWALVFLILLGKISLFNRSGAALYLLQLVMLKPLLRDLRIRSRTVIKGLLLVGVLVFPAFYHYLGDLPVSQFISVYFLDRVFMAPYYGMINYFSWFPDILPHAAGRNISIVNQLWYGGQEYTPAMLRFAQEAGNYYGSFNAMFVAEAWADFGYPGVFVVSLLVGGWATTADVIVYGIGTKTREAAAVMACVVYGVFVLSATAAQTALFSGGLALIPLIALGLQQLSKRRHEELAGTHG